MSLVLSSATSVASLSEASYQDAITYDGKKVTLPGTTSLSSAPGLNTTSYVSLSPPSSQPASPTGRRVPAALISTFEADHLSLSPGGLNRGRSEADLFSSFADSVDTPMPSPLKTEHQKRKTISPSKISVLSPVHVPMHSILLPQEDSVHIPEKEPSRVTPATARRRARSQRSLLHLDSELDVSMSVTQLSIDDPHTTPFPNLQRQPIFRPLPGKRLSNNPYVDPRSSVDLYNYSVHMTNSPNLRPMASASLANLSEMSDELNVLGGELDSSQHLPAHPLPQPQQPQQHTLPVPLADSLSVTVSEPSQASLRHAPQLAPAPAPAPSPGHENHYVSLYRPSTGSFRHQSLDPLPFQVHSRVLGWKLTSVQRRKELVDVLDMMKEKAHKLSSLSKSSLARRHVNTFTADDFLRDMAAASSSADPDDPRKSTTREAEAWQSYVTRNVQSRQNYKSPQHIRSLMEDKRRTEKLTEFSAQRYELLRNRAAAQQKRRPDLLNERSTDESLERRNQQILRQLNIPALPTPKAGARRSASTPKLGSPKSRPRSQQAQDSAQHLYNFPKNIYKPRDRMDILESVQIRSRLEGHLSREREAQKERLVADFLADGLDMFSSDSAAHRGLDDGSDFASLADSFLAGGLEPLDMDSALEKFGRGLQREPEFDDIEADLLAAEEDVDG